VDPAAEEERGPDGTGVEEERGAVVEEEERGIDVEEEWGIGMEAHAKDAVEGVQWRVNTEEGTRWRADTEEERAPAGVGK
jgi:hypothetical protein